MFPHILSVLSLFGVVTVNAMGQTVPTQAVLGKEVLPLNDRYANTFVSDIFKDNILLTLHYMDGSVISGSRVNWGKIEGDFTYSFSLNPHQTFAFHDQILPQFSGTVVKTTNAHFNSSEGFKSDGLLVADGVCHLASFMNWVSRDAGLTVVAPTNHDFARIPDVDRTYGTAIYYMPGQGSSSELQNLYVTNNKTKPVTFTFIYKDNTLTLQIVEAK